MRARPSPDALRAVLTHLDSPPLEANQLLALESLQRTLDRMLTAKERLDIKATALPAAIGVIAAIVVERINTSPVNADFARLLTVSSASAAVVASLLALACLNASGHAVGPSAADLVHQSNADELRYRQRVMIGLAVAVDDAAYVVAEKGVRLNLALFSGALAVLFILGLGMVGGLQ